MAELEKPIEEEAGSESSGSDNDEFTFEEEPNEVLARYRDEYRKYEGFYLTFFEEVFIGGIRPAEPECLDEFISVTKYAIEQYNRTSAEEPLELAEIIRCNWGFGKGTVCLVTFGATNGKFYETKVSIVHEDENYYFFLRPSRHYPTLNPISSSSSSSSSQPTPANGSH